MRGRLCMPLTLFLTMIWEPQLLHSCMAGFAIVGDEVRTCMANDTAGVWSGAAPTCEGKGTGVA